MFLMARKSRRKKRSKKKSRKSRKKSLPQIHISRDAQLDIVGYGMLAVALLTFLALLSAQRGMLLGPWVRFLSGLFGWGVYLVPFFIGAIGFYLVFRRFGDRIPRPDPEQVVGILLLFVCFLITAHFGVLWSTALSPQQIMAGGYGGGQTGAWFAQLLVLGLGKAGTVLVVLVAWLLGIAFTFSISPADMLEGLLAAGRKVRPEGKTRRRPSPVTAAPQPRINGAQARPPAPEPAPAPAPSPAASEVKSASPKKSEPHPIPDYAYPQQLIGDSMLQLPTLDAILEPGDDQHLDQGYLRQQSRIIEETLASLGTPVAVREINRGPVVTQFGVEPKRVTNSRGRETRVKVSKISSLADDLALALSAKSIRIQTPIPGKGLVGIEVPNQEISLVALRDIIESEEWMESRSRLRLGMGQDVSGQPVVADLADMPHLLIAGTTGSGKSVCINSILAALLLQNTPQDLKLLMVDPKRVELTQYNGIPHLLAPVVVEMERVVGALKWVLREMDGRYRRFAEAGAREISDYNERIAAQDPEAKKMPYIVVVVDELADLMMLAPQETERAICRLAQMARATGIHLIIATQRPSVDVVTGLIKANFPARIAFAVASSVDSRVILDVPGAERLLGRGDMLFMPPDVAEPVRLQGAFVSDEELRRLVRYWKGGRQLESPSATTLTAPPPSEATQIPLQDKLAPLIEFEDDLLPDAIEVLLAEDRASISLLQRRLRIGYTRSARIVDLLEEMKIIGPPQSGGQTRDVYREAAEELLRQAGKLM